MLKSCWSFAGHRLEKFGRLPQLSSGEGSCHGRGEGTAHARARTSVAFMHTSGFLTSRSLGLQRSVAFAHPEHHKFNFPLIAKNTYGARAPVRVVPST